MSDNMNADWPRQLLELVTETQRQLMLDENPRAGFDYLLEGLLSLAGSEYGFVGEVVTTEDGRAFLRTLGISDIAWNPQTCKFYDKYKESGLEFRNLDSLFGRVITTGQPLIANYPATHPDSAGLPPGHPPLNAFLGLPLRVGDELVGVVGLSNREGGYDQLLLEALEPMVRAGGAMILAARERRHQIAAEAKVRGVELLRHSVVETALDCVIAMDHEGSIIEFNPAAEKTFGWSREEVMGRALADIVIPEELRQNHHEGLAHYLATGEGPVLGHRIEVSAIRRDGTRFPIELAITAAQLQDNPVFTAYLRDITERKRVESELGRSKEAAEAASRAKTAFVATVSHEIRTPINAITGALGLLETADLSSADRNFLHTAQQSADALLGLVNDVLDLSRIDADRLSVELASALPEEICDGVVELLAGRADARGNLVGSVISRGVPGAVMIDAGKVRQILINLVTNAIKFTRNGNVRIDVRTHEEELQFSVSDTGVGIAEEDMPKLFSEFVQLGGAREHGGAGLGLAISKRLVELMKGTISATSTPGKGSCFSFSIPFAEGEVVAKRTLRGRKGLIAGSDSFLGQIVMEQCRAWGIECERLAVGQRAEHVLNIEEGIEFLLLVFDSFPSASELSDGLELSAAAREKGVPLGLVAGTSKECVECLERKLHADVAVSCPLLQGDLAGNISTLVTGLPAAETAWSNRMSIASASDPHIRVLLADDSQANRLVMAEMLRRSGFTVDVVADGNEAVEAVTLLPYHVVLMDIEMPDLDGIAATRQIRGLETPQANVPIIALTANVLADSRERFLGAGMNDYVSKPVDRQNLIAAVLKWADTKSSAESGLVEHTERNPYVDEEALRTLGADTSPDMLPKMVEVFVAELRSRAESISRGIDSSDTALLASEAHALRSSAATYGACAIAEHAKRIDQACKDDSRSSALTQARALLENVEPTIRALEAHPLTRS